ncbi:rho-related GTP-binding protein RhoU isoform X1 [Sinocyclocheilus anshuiensis]|uniref:rho-related GTP-binding protein RhoU isoform X1 n=1 Tax=Sinocyclocheilus anshuiensis TaxID=1608454 RepID=UPI0007B9464B|nr:PREDICTED: rho-related GTP-binding protein RhoU-like isoform X1 [Sinocyclocheilus anshuiensis]XP_016362060.1 PREDICTED: rho-related GTP-binding protein RhoU-like isoform X1 [Sinocyclocheilus anshuiensis]XP_016362061.1 PREDICTED: rho-related GTP-binding protein RhoU-like isoform X1 [Sinocyclocheilus anshuiensis]
MPSQDEAETVNEDDCPPPVPPRANLQLKSPERRVRCVLVGDAAVGKTSLVISYTTNGYQAEYIPTAFDNFTARVVVDGRPVQLQLCDMAGQRWGAADQPLYDEFERLRPLCYRDADVFLLCYSVVLPSSFRSVMDRWAPEVHRLCPGVPIILVGTQCDLREDVQVLIRLADGQEKPVSRDEACLCARSIGAVTFAECSALTQKNLKEVFDGAILASMRHAEEAAWPTMHTLREKTPDKIKQLSETWWRKLSCVQSFDLQ